MLVFQVFSTEKRIDFFTLTLRRFLAILAVATPYRSVPGSSLCPDLADGLSRNTSVPRSVKRRIGMPAPLRPIGFALVTLMTAGSDHQDVGLCL
jgi:hypothetical protein